MAAIVDPQVSDATASRGADGGPFKPFDRAAELPEDGPETEIEIPILWVIGALLVCLCVCRWCWKRCRGRKGRRTEEDAALKGDQSGGDTTDDDDVYGDAEAIELARSIVRIVGYEPLASGRLEYSGIDDRGNELTLDRDDLLAAGGDAERMVRAYERRYPPPFTPRSSIK